MIVLPGAASFSTSGLLTSPSRRATTPAASTRTTQSGHCAQPHGEPSHALCGPPGVTRPKRDEREQPADNHPQQTGSRRYRVGPADGRKRVTEFFEPHTLRAELRLCGLANAC